MADEQGGNKRPGECITPRYRMLTHSTSSSVRLTSSPYPPFPTLCSPIPKSLAHPFVTYREPQLEASSQDGHLKRVHLPLQLLYSPHTRVAQERLFEVRASGNWD